VSTDSLEMVFKKIEIMAGIETALARLYKKCAGLFSESYDFWTELSRDEIDHASVLSELAELMRKMPDKFRPGKTFAPKALENFASRIQANMEKLDSPAVTERDALLMAYHMESTMIDRNYTEVVETDHRAYTEGLEILAEASKAHRDRVLKKMHEHK